MKLEFNALVMGVLVACEARKDSIVRVRENGAKGFGEGRKKELAS